MGVEIERKFLLCSDAWREDVQGIRYCQGYLSRDIDATVRVRIAGDTGWLTIKGRTIGISRQEFEYEVPVEDAEQILTTMCGGHVVEKTRYKIQHGDHLWEIDLFAGRNEGLSLAEVELDSEDEVVDLPPWIGKEVSGDYHYHNSYLAAHPYQTW